MKFNTKNTNLCYLFSTKTMSECVCINRVNRFCKKMFDYWITRFLENFDGSYEERLVSKYC